MRIRNDVAKPPIVLRPLRWFILIFGGGATAVLMYFVVGSIAAGLGFAAAAIWLGVLIAVVVVMVNYLWFHYVTIDDDAVERVRYLGILRDRVPIRELTSVGTRPIEVSFGLVRPRPSVQFRSAHGGIEIMSHSYPTEPVREAVAMLKGKGIPVDAKLQRALKID